MRHYRGAIPEPDSSVRSTSALILMARQDKSGPVVPAVMIGLMLLLMPFDAWIFLYLAFRYPVLYTPYQHKPFVQFLKTVKAVDPPIVPDVERFSKVSRIIFKMMQNDEELMELHERRLIPGESYEEESLMIVYDFYRTMMA